MMENSINLDAIQKIIAAQESYLEHKKIFKTKQKTEQLFPKFKQHYEMIRVLNSILSDQSKNIQKQTFNYSRIIETYNITIPSLINMIQFATLQLNSKDLIDYLTFSIIPSYFDFFLTESSIKRLIDFFILLQNNPSYDLIARAVFISPGFLHYSTFALQPIFSSIIDNDNIKKLDDIKYYNEIFKNVYKYNYLIPKEALVAILCSTNMIKTLQNSFFDCAFSSKKSFYMYNLLHISQKTKFNAEQCKKFASCIEVILSKMLCKNPNLTLISDLINSSLMKYDQNKEFKLKEAVNKGKCKYIDDELHEDDKNNLNFEENIQVSKYNNIMPSSELFNDKDCDNFPELFQPIFLSSKDINFFDFYNKKVTYFDPFPSNNDYSFYFLVFNRSDVKYQKFLEKNKKLLKTYKMNQLTYYLSQLFDMAPKLPKLKSVPENIDTIQSFFDFYFVQKGSGEGFEKRRNLCESFFNYPDLNIPKDFDKLMINFSINDLGKAELEKLNSLSSKSYTLNLIVEKAIDNTKFLLQSSWFKLQNARIYNKHNYSENPNLLENEYYKLCNNHTQMVFPEIEMKMLFNKMISKNGLNLESFAKARNQIRYYPCLDELESKFISFFSDIYACSEYINEKFKIKNGRFDKYAYLLRNVLSYPHNYHQNIQNNHQIDYDIAKQLNNAHFDRYPKIDMNISVTISDVIIGAFLEDSILRKYEVLSTAFAMITNDVNNHYPKNVNASLVKEDFGPVFTSILMRINPPKLLTNIVMMIDLIGNLPILDIFDGYSPTINSCLNEILDYFIIKNPNIIDKNSLFLYDDTLDS